MKVVATPRLEALVASFAAIYGDGILWDNSKNNPDHMIVTCNPDLILIAEDEQNKDLEKSAVKNEVPVVVVNGESKFTHFREIEVAPAANIVQIVGGKHDDTLVHDVVMFLYNFHAININALNQILRICRKYKFGLFGDRPLGHSYKGVPSFQEQADLMASSKATICLTPEDCCNTAANNGNGICLQTNDWYPEFSEETLMRAVKSQNKTFIQGNKQKVFEDSTMLDRVVDIVRLVNPDGVPNIEEIKEKAFNK